MIHVTSTRSLTWRKKRYRCSIGRSGILTNKHEGDGATPAGTFPLLRVLYRSDRLDSPETKLPVQPLCSNDGWCNEPTHRDYNQHVKLPHIASHESLWRDDNVYDIIVVIGHNYLPVLTGCGSAIFLHVAKPSFEPTAGCIALEIMDLQEVLRTCSQTTMLKVTRSSIIF